MFEISQLKEKTLVELQEIAKTIGAKKFSQLKKLDLVYLILDIQASTPTKITKKEPSSNDGKPRRRRIIKKPNAPKVNKITPTENVQKELALETKADVRPEQKRDVYLGEGMTILIGDMNQLEENTISLWTLTHNLRRGATWAGRQGLELYLKEYKGMF